MPSFPTTVWTLNPQDETNDGAPDNTVAQAHDYNLAAAEIGALETELGVSAVAGQSLRGSAASLLARLNVSLNYDGTFKASQKDLAGASPIAILSSDNAGVISDIGSSGAPSVHPGNLPTPIRGLYYFVIVSGTGTGLRLVATNSARIRLNGDISAVNGYIESVDPGANIILVALSTTLWVAIGPQGVWNLDGA